jgi:hypothetical protein
MTERMSDGLPLTLDGKSVEWEPWLTAPVLTHIDMSCPGCGEQRPPRMTKGRIMIPARRRRLNDPEERPLIRFWAFRCPGCRETRIYDRVPPEDATERMPLIEYMRPIVAMQQEPIT